MNIPTLVLPLLVAASSAWAEPTFEKIAIDPLFRSEGVDIGDVNKDGKNDVIVGDLWYEAPDWKPHEIRKPRKPNRGGYTEAFGVYTDDYNKDGWVDVLVIPFHGKDVKWYENPKGKYDAHWKERVAFKQTGNETRSYLDLFKDGKRVFLMGVEGRIAWVAVPDNPDGLWPVHWISAEDDKAARAPAHKYAHGLGAGDVNGDGRLDVLHTNGWFEQPAEGKKHTEAWKHHPVKIGKDKYADMFTIDTDGDGRNDIFSTSAHGIGVYWHNQKGDKDNPTFETHMLFKKIRETHGARFVDIDGDGKKDLVTGRRFCAHGYKPSRDSEPAEIYWFKIKPVKGGPPELTPHKVDDQSGIGCQFEVLDFNGDGKMDIVTSGRKGVYLFLQK